MRLRVRNWKTRSVTPTGRISYSRLAHDILGSEESQQFVFENDGPKCFCRSCHKGRDTGRSAYVEEALHESTSSEEFSRKDAKAQSATAFLEGFFAPLHFAREILPKRLLTALSHRSIRALPSLNSWSRIHAADACLPFAGFQRGYEYP